MGWDGHYKHNYNGKQDWIKREILADEDTWHWKYVRHAMAGSTVWVHRRHDVTGDDMLSCHLTDGRGDCWTKKDISVDMGPCYYNCPAYLIKGIRWEGVIARGYTSGWLAKWAEVHSPEKRKQTVKLFDGAVVKYESPLGFTNGEHVDTFAVRFTQWGNRKRATYYRVTGNRWEAYRGYRLRGVTTKKRIVGKIVGSWEGAECTGQVEFN